MSTNSLYLTQSNIEFPSNVFYLLKVIEITWLEYRKFSLSKIYPHEYYNLSTQITNNKHFANITYKRIIKRNIK